MASFAGRKRTERIHLNPPIDDRLKLTTDFSRVFKGPDSTLVPLTALCKTRTVAISNNGEGKEQLIIGSFLAESPMLPGTKSRGKVTGKVLIVGFLNQFLHALALSAA